MQQLSLFEFDDEELKGSKKKKSSKKDNKNSSPKDLFVQENVAEDEENLSTNFNIDELENEDEIIDFSEEKEINTKTDKIEKDNDNKETVITKKRGRKSFKEIDAEVDLINVPTDEELFQKQYYPISVVAKWFRVNASLLRFWENQFSILKPKKNKKGDRYFRPEDVKNLQIIYYLLRQKKLTIEGAQKHLKAHKEHTETDLQLIQSLNNFKSFLLELKANV